MLSLVYISSAVVEFSPAGLVELLVECREKNTAANITGMLLYKKSNFIQVLEGPDEAVRARFATIKQDPRHRGILCLLEMPIEQRRFPDWSMGFRNLDDQALHEVPGYSEFMNEPFTSDSYRNDPSRAMHLLGIFRRNMS